MPTLQANHSWQYLLAILQGKEAERGAVEAPQRARGLREIVQQHKLILIFISQHGNSLQHSKRNQYSTKRNQFDWPHFHHSQVRRFQGEESGSFENYLSS